MKTLNYEESVKFVEDYIRMLATDKACRRHFRIDKRGPHPDIQKIYTENLQELKKACYNYFARKITLHPDVKLKVDKEVLDKLARQKLNELFEIFDPLKYL